MKYDPIKQKLGVFFNKSPFLRVLFYKLLDLLLLRAWYVKRELKKWKKNAPKNAQILDAGAGFGQYTHYISTLSETWNILGVDIKEEQVADCKQFFAKLGMAERVDFRVAELTTFRQENQYELILSVDVMEHILEDVAVFKNFYASLKKGGMLLISTPSDQGGSDVHHEDEHSFIDEHVRDGYGTDEIKIKLQQAGFSKIESRYTYGKMGSLSWKISMKYPILMLNASKLFYFVLPFYYLLFFPISFVLNAIDTRRKHKSGTGLLVKAFK